MASRPHTTACKQGPAGAHSLCAQAPSSLTSGMALQHVHAIHQGALALAGLQHIQQALPRLTHARTCRAPGRVSRVFPGALHLVSGQQSAAMGDRLWRQAHELQASPSGHKGQGRMACTAGLMWSALSQCMCGRSSRWAHSSHSWGHGWS